MKDLVKIVCIYCGADLSEKGGERAESTGHGICEKCWETLIWWMMDFTL